LHNSCTSACNCHQQQTNSFLCLLAFQLLWLSTIRFWCGSTVFFYSSFVMNKKKVPGCYQHLFWDFFWICGFLVMLCFLAFCEQREIGLGNWGSEDGENWDHFLCVCVWVLWIVWGRR
jgi:hypothetical protein